MLDKALDLSGFQSPVVSVLLSSIALAFTWHLAAHEWRWLSNFLDPFTPYLVGGWLYILFFGGFSAIVLEGVKPQPSFEMRIDLLQSSYAPQVEVLGNKWRKDYRLYGFTISNKGPLPILDATFKASLPLAIIAKEVVTRAGAQDVEVYTSADSEEPPAFSPNTCPPEFVPYQQFRNDMHVTIGALRPAGELLLKFIGSTQSSAPTGSISVKYWYDDQGTRHGPTTAVYLIAPTNGVEPNDIRELRVATEPLTNPCREVHHFWMTPNGPPIAEGINIDGFQVTALADCKPGELPETGRPTPYLLPSQLK